MRARRLLIPVVMVALVIVALHFVLDPIATRIVRSRLASLEAYTGSVADVDVRVLSPAVVLRDLRLRQRTVGGGSVPVLEAPRVSIDAKWSSLVKKPIHARIDVKQPTITHIANARPVPEAETDWRDKVRAAAPFVIDEVDVDQGRVVYVGKEQRQLEITNLEASVTGFSNNAAPQKGELPVGFDATGQLAGGKVSLRGTMSPLESPERAHVLLHAEDLGLAGLTAVAPAPKLWDGAQGTVDVDADLALGARVQGTVRGAFQDVLLTSLGTLAPDLPDMPGFLERFGGDLGEKAERRVEKGGRSIAKLAPSDFEATIRVDAARTDRPLDAILYQVGQRLLQAAIEKTLARLG